MTDPTLSEVMREEAQKNQPYFSLHGFAASIVSHLIAFAFGMAVSIF